MVMSCGGMAALVPAVLVPSVLVPAVQDAGAGDLWLGG